MCPADAAAAGLKDNDFVSVRVGNERGVVLDQVKIRVDESFTTEMHIDTDEANASLVSQADQASIIYKESSDCVFLGRDRLSIHKFDGELL